MTDEERRSVDRKPGQLNPYVYDEAIARQIASEEAAEPVAPAIRVTVGGVEVREAPDEVPEFDKP